MRNLAILLFIICPFLLISQKSGKVIYEVETKIELPDEMKDKPEMQSIIADMPKSRKKKKELIYYGNKSIYKNIIKEKATNERTGYMYSYKQPDEQYYFDTKTKENIHLTEFFGKTFLITEEREARKWKMTKKQKMIGEYLCFQAITGDSTDKVIAWFTPQVITSAAPMKMNGLPGLILEAIMNEGRIRLTMKDLELDTIKEEDIEKPKKGKKITREDFKILEEKKMKEMEEQYGKGKRMIFRR